MTNTNTISRLSSSTTESLLSFDESSLYHDDDDDDDDQETEFVLSQLTQQEIELAARAASYNYLCESSSCSSCPVKNEEQRALARDFVCRFTSSTSNPDKALCRAKATLAFRQESNVDALRTAFDKDNNVKTDKNATRKELEKQLQSKSLYVQGYDKQGRSTYIFVTSNVQQHDPEWTLKAHMYTLERALACSRHGTVNAMIDFKGFSLSKHAPPMSIGKQFMNVFRQHYAGAIHQIYLIDAPTAFSVLWSVLKNFVGTKTREKIHFIQSKKAAKHLTPLYDNDQLAPWMMAGGTNDAEFDLDEYLYKTPFDAAFGDAVN